MKVLSIQKSKGDCVLHSLKNSGAVKTYKEALELNIEFQKYWARIGKISHNRFKELFSEHFEGNYLICPFLRNIKNSQHPFLVYAFEQLNLKVKERKEGKVKHLPKEFTGIVLVEFDADDGEGLSGHAAGVQKGHVLDSHWKVSRPLHKYPRQNLVTSYHFLN